MLIAIAQGLLDAVWGLWRSEPPPEPDLVVAPRSFADAVEYRYHDSHFAYQRKSDGVVFDALPIHDNQAVAVFSAAMLDPLPGGARVTYNTVRREFTTEISARRDTNE